MKITDYLSKKYADAQVMSITAFEAKILGIQYPLKSGWLKSHGHREISADQKAMLIKKLQAKLDQPLQPGQKMSPYHLAGLRALGAGPVEDEAFYITKIYDLAQEFRTRFGHSPA